MFNEAYQRFVQLGSNCCSFIVILLRLSVNDPLNGSVASSTLHQKR